MRIEVSPCPRRQGAHQVDLLTERFGRVEELEIKVVASAGRVGALDDEGPPVRQQKLTRVIAPFAHGLVPLPALRERVEGEGLVESQPVVTDIGHHSAGDQHPPVGEQRRAAAKEVVRLARGRIGRGYHILEGPGPWVPQDGVCRRVLALAGIAEPEDLAGR